MRTVHGISARGDDGGPRQGRFPGNSGVEVKQEWAKENLRDAEAQTAHAIQEVWRWRGGEIRQWERENVELFCFFLRRRRNRQVSMSTGRTRQKTGVNTQDRTSCSLIPQGRLKTHIVLRVCIKQTQCYKFIRNQFFTASTRRGFTEYTTFRINHSSNSRGL